MESQWNHSSLEVNRSMQTPEFDSETLKKNILENSNFGDIKFLIQPGTMYFQTGKKLIRYTVLSAEHLNNYKI